MLASGLTKYEIVDPVTLESLILLNDAPYVKTFEKMSKLSKTIRNRVNTMPVKYNYAKGLESLCVGRLYPESHSQGLMVKRYRDAMLRDNYWDLDMVNAHFTLACHFCKKFELRHVMIEKYVNDREYYLKLIYPADRNEAKKILLKIGYGGSIPDTMDEHTAYELPVEYVGVSSWDKAPANYNQEGPAFARDLQCEMRGLAQYVYNTHPAWWNLSTKNGKTQIKNRSNKEFVLLSLFLQTEENKVLCAMDKYFFLNMRTVGILMYDGLALKKAEDELELPQELIEGCEKYITEITGVKMSLKVKEWDYSTEYKKQGELTYAAFKEEQERDHFWMNGNFYRLDEDISGNVNLVGITKFKTYYGSVNEKRLDLWKADRTRRVYKSMNFYPKQECPSHVLNLYTGLGIENKLNTAKANGLNDELTNEAIGFYNTSKLKWQIETVFCRDNPKVIEYFYQWHARIVCEPNLKTRKCLVLRNECGGSGKSGFYEYFFIPHILGSKYGHMASNVNSVFGNFNSALQNKLLIVVEEGEIAKLGEFVNIIKDVVTRKTNVINCKYLAERSEYNYINLIINTNKETPIPAHIGGQDRIVYFDCAEHTLSFEEVKQLKNETEDFNMHWIFYKILCSIYDKDFDFDRVPESKTKEILKQKYRPDLINVLSYICYDWDEKDDMDTNIIITSDDELTFKCKQFFNIFCYILGKIKSNSRVMSYQQFSHDKTLTELKDKNIVKYEKLESYTFSKTRIKEYITENYEEPVFKKQKLINE